MARKVHKTIPANKRRQARKMSVQWQVELANGDAELHVVDEVDVHWVKHLPGGAKPVGRGANRGTPNHFATIEETWRGSGWVKVNDEQTETIAA